MILINKCECRGRRSDSGDAWWLHNMLAFQILWKGVVYIATFVVMIGVWLPGYRVEQVMCS